MSFLHLKKGVLRVKSRVLGKSPWHDEECFSESVNAQFNLSGNLLSCEFIQVLSSGDFEGTSARQNAFVLNSVADCAQTVTDGVSGLCNRVVVWSLDQDCAGEGVFDALDEGVLVFAKGLFVNYFRETEIGLSYVVDGVEHLTTTGKWDSFSVSLLCASNANDTGTGKDFEGGWVDSLLVNYNEVLVSSIAELFLELNDLMNFVVSERALTCNEFLSLVGVGPEEAGVDFGLLVLEGYIQTHDVAVLKACRKVTLATTVVED